MSHNRTMPTFAKTRQAEQAALDWFRSAAASRLMTVEQAELIPALTSVHGSHALYLRPSATANSMLSGHLLGDVMSLHVRGDGGGWDGDLRCGAEGFPIEDGSLALVYLLHSLDHCTNPQRLLGEVMRMLQPDGCLISVGLNPWSPWSWRWRGRGPIGRSASRTARLIEQSGLTLLRSYRLGPLSPFDGADLPRVPELHSSLSGGLRAGYAWCARKRVQSLTPDAKAARQRAQLMRGRTEAAPNAG
ncbi:MAG TPA: methyltransferase domain-containing protein [Xanthomonadaceae bacterium]|nr:methyltransferase domain-containing protein [Xanthomonadales bacterium]HPF72192.1 methyltransferase domain-containing protein [Xanthomonadaceae bacterium]HRX99409.1 methyltransferase domain-containing protein [Xanthomonadaceae bacterium]